MELNIAAQREMSGMDGQGRGILIIVENLPVPFDRRVWQEAQALRDAGYKVSVICPIGKGHESTRETLDGIEIYRHHLPLEAKRARDFIQEYASALWAQIRLSFKVRREQGFDVIQGCNPPDLIFIVAAIHKLFGGKRYIFDHHDLSPELFESKFERRGFMHRVLALCERLTFALADVSIATNETFKRIAVQRGGMDPEKVFVVKSYPKLERFRRVDPKPGLKSVGTSLVGYVGIMARQDGVDYLVRAMARIRDMGREDVACMIVGDGPELEPLRRLAEELGVADRVTFTGYLSGDELLSHLSALDVGVIPDPHTPFNDKLSMNKVFEYMMLGLPFVQFDLKQARSESRDAALVVEECTPDAMADGILKLIDDPDRRAWMSSYGRAVAEAEFRWSNEATQLLAAYATALGDPVPAPTRAAPAKQSGA